MRGARSGLGLASGAEDAESLVAACRSYGIVCFEVFSYGEKPYGGISNMILHIKVRCMGGGALQVNADSEGSGTAHLRTA